VEEEIKEKSVKTDSESNSVFTTSNTNRMSYYDTSPKPEIQQEHSQRKLREFQQFTVLDSLFNQINNYINCKNYYSNFSYEQNCFYQDIVRMMNLAKN
jgi:hypothetical protein